MDKSADRIVKRFDYNRLVRQTTMPIITIFNKNRLILIMIVS